MSRPIREPGNLVWAAGAIPFAPFGLVFLPSALRGDPYGIWGLLGCVGVGLTRAGFWLFYGRRNHLQIGSHSISVTAGGVTTTFSAGAVTEVTWQGLSGPRLLSPKAQDGHVGFLLNTGDSVHLTPRFATNMGANRAKRELAAVTTRAVWRGM